MYETNRDEEGQVQKYQKRGGTVQVETFERRSQSTIQEKKVTEKGDTEAKRSLHDIQKQRETRDREKRPSETSKTKQGPDMRSSGD